MSIKDYVKNIKRLSSMLTTYNTGLVQTKAYRALKNRTDFLLKDHNISTVSWAFLGSLYEHTLGMRSTELAEVLGVEPPFVTQIYQSLHKQGFVEMKIVPEDRRAKLIILTVMGRKFVEVTEKYLRKEMRVLLKDLSIKEILTYIKVISKIVENEQKIRRP